MFDLRETIFKALHSYPPDRDGNLRDLTEYLAAELSVGNRTVAGRTVAEWREFAKRDDCLDHMVPSDLRAILGAIL